MAAKVFFLWTVRFAVAVILAAWVCIWFLKPTKLWKRSWHAAEDRASSTSLGATGLNVVVFSFPLLLVAALGFIVKHLYMIKERTRRCSASLNFKIWNPAIVHSPIGILSYGEVLAGTILIAFLVWTYYSNVSTDLKKLTPLKSLQLSRPQMRAMRLAVRLGSLSEACLALLLLPVLRKMSLLQVLGVQFEASVRYHIWLGNAVMFFSILHGVGIMSVWGSKGQLLEEISKWQTTGRVNIAGLISLAIGIIIWITSLPQIRRKYFLLFFSAHHLYALFLLFFLFHAGDRHFFLILSGVLLFALDKILRIIQSRPETGIISTRLLPCRAVELTLAKHSHVKYHPASTIFIKIPSISKLQWHPFSIITSSNKDRNRFSILVKCQGVWTNALYNLIDSDGSKQIPVSIEGPYGPISCPYGRYDSLILIAGGSGITPFLSILQDIASREHCVGINPMKVQLIYIVKRFQDLYMLAPISSIVLNQTSENGYLKLELFVTREDKTTRTVKDVLLEMSELKAVVLQENPPMHALSQPESVLFKAAAVAVSSVVFLISVVCLTHRFVSEGKNSSSDTKTPSWENDLLVLCSLAIAVSCTAMMRALSGRKSENGHSEISHKHAKSDEMCTPNTPESQEAIEISFGKQPNLIEVLSKFPKEAAESNVGVFVCGPESMQVSVASFCKNSNKSNSSGHKQNCRYTFHSINFSL